MVASSVLQLNAYLCGRGRPHDSRPRGQRYEARSRASFVQRYCGKARRFRLKFRRFRESLVRAHVVCVRPFAPATGTVIYRSFPAGAKDAGTHTLVVHGKTGGCEFVRSFGVSVRGPGPMPDLLCV